MTIEDSAAVFGRLLRRKAAEAGYSSAPRGSFRISEDRVLRPPRRALLRGLDEAGKPHSSLADFRLDREGEEALAFVPHGVPLQAAALDGGDAILPSPLGPSTTAREFVLAATPEGPRERDRRGRRPLGTLALAAAFPFLRDGEILVHPGTPWPISAHEALEARMRAAALGDGANLLLRKARSAMDSRLGPRAALILVRKGNLALLCGASFFPGTGGGPGLAIDSAAASAAVFHVA